MNRILIVRMSALGDIVHALPVLAALRDAFPTAEIDWLAESHYAGVLDLVDGLSRQIVVRPGYLRAIGELRARHYDAAVDLQGLIKSAFAAKLSGATRVIGFETPALRESAASWFYSEHVGVPDRAHIIQKNLAVLPALGVERRTVAFPFRRIESAVANEVAATARARGEGRYVLLNPGAAWPNKRWPPERFGAVGREIRERYGLPTFVLWGRGESELADQVVAASAGAAARAPETSLADLLAVCRGASLMISGDTGPTHIAAAVGTPLVGLYGPTWPERNGPWHPDDVNVSRAESCACHHKRACRRASRCIDDITVEEVLIAVEQRLAKAVNR